MEPEQIGSARPHRFLGAAPCARPGPREHARQPGGLAEAGRGPPVVGRRPNFGGNPSVKRMCLMFHLDVFFWEESDGQIRCTPGE